MEDRPGLVEKLAFFGGVAGGALMGAASGFLLLYLTDVVGIGAAAVGTLMLVARIVDGASDPIMGYLVDHLPVTRWGRFRLYVLIGGILCAVCLVALFAAPAWFPNALLAAWITYLLWGLLLDLFQIPVTSLLPVVAGDARTRSQLASIVGLTGLLAAALSTGATLPIVKALGGGTGGWLTYVSMIALVGCVLVTVMAVRVRERVKPLSPERYRLSDVRRVFFAHRAVPILLTSKVAVQAASGSLTAAMPYFFLYYIGDQAYLSAAALVMAVPMVVGAIVVPVMARRHGAKPWYLLSLAVSIAGLALLMAVPPTPLPVLACFALTGFGFGGAVALGLVLLAELADYTEWQYGFRTEASLAAMTSFATKAGSGVGGGLLAYTLAATGYRSGGVAQDPEAIQGILYAQSLIPAAIGIVGALAFAAYPITREIASRAAADLADRKLLATQP
ncbi:MFS transporter [Nonomuraea sp. NPDC059023]|uniref:MFS transporter n=1 Tax=unclassified Nonomuraea TaxID=2593643 RepID=UPI00368D5A7A